MEKKFLSKALLTAITAMDWHTLSEQEVEKDWVRVIKTTWEGELKRVCEDAKLFSTQARRSQFQNLSFLFYQNNLHHPALAKRATTERQLPKIDKVWKERLHVGHSFIFNSSRGFILNSEAVSTTTEKT